VANLTAQQEAFARAVAGGMSQSDALRSAYPSSLKWQQKTIHESASKLMADTKVATRVQELRRPAVEAVEMSAKAHVARLLRISEAAFQAGDFGPSARAEIAIGQVAGHYTQKVEVSTSWLSQLDAHKKVELISALEDVLSRRRQLAHSAGEAQDVEVKE
jgi:hypothetical protein